jgi:hypothetical protein
MNKQTRKRQNIRVVNGAVMPLYMEPSQKAHNILAAAMDKGFNQKGYVERALQMAYDFDVAAKVLPKMDQATAGA